MASTYLDIVRCSRPVGPIESGACTRNRYDGDDATTWAAQQLVELTSGAIAAVQGSAGALDTTDISTSCKLFMARKAVGTATDEKVAVERIKTTSLCEGPLVSSDSTGTAPPTAPTTIIGTKYSLYEDADGLWAVDKYNTTNPVVEIVDVESNYRYFHDPKLYQNSSSAQYNFVKFKFIALSDA